MTVIELADRLPPRVCSTCEHHAIGATGVFCTLWMEHIWNETAAEDCGDYEPSS